MKDKKFMIIDKAGSGKFEEAKATLKTENIKNSIINEKHEKIFDSLQRYNDNNKITEYFSNLID